MDQAPPARASTVTLPAAPSIAAGPGGAVWISAEGEIEEISHAQAARRAGEGAPIVCHAPVLARRLGAAHLAAYDVLELFAFVRPARFCVPTARGLASALSLRLPSGLVAEAAALRVAALALLSELASAVQSGEDRDAAEVAAIMAGAGWPWGPAVVAATGAAAETGAGLEAWNRVPKWREGAPEPAPGHAPVSSDEAREQLKSLLGEGAEPRPEQADYAAEAAHAFAPRDEAGAPRVVLAEAGTGTGKTLAYIAPASLWARRNHGPVWISTFTKNLQRQIDQELDRLYPEPRLKAQKAVIRKGRENYLCLLNFEEAARGARGGTPALEGAAGVGEAPPLVALGLLARWVRATRDGDLLGGDFPSWLVEMLGRRRTLALTDHRGECIYSACGHYRRCFIERAVRKARRAEIVIANHALVMVNAAGGRREAQLPSRYVFDESHHLFEAADNAFSAQLSGAECVELRRWLRGEDRARNSRLKGLRRRLGDLMAGAPAAEAALARMVRAAAALPRAGWMGRIQAGAPAGPAEAFLERCRTQVHARSAAADSGYGLEATLDEPVPGMIEAAAALEAALGRVAEPVKVLAERLAAMMDEDAAELETDARTRIEAARRGLDRRATVIEDWRAMLRDLRRGGAPERYVDWLSVERRAGREFDVALNRHWIDPTVPFAEAVLGRAHGALITSATMRDRSADSGDDWATAEVRTGARHLALPPRRASVPSPFDYAAKTRIFVVTDVRRDDPRQVAAAYRELFVAAGGGALGLFTAIARLAAVHRRIAAPLDHKGITLLAQHVDGIDTATLVDIFRAEPDSCLLGTDAVRDGVDVPGRSLRLIVFDRVPWPRPDIVHRARRAAFGGPRYDDMITRLRLKQAYGRLVRSADDEGIFVVLDAMLPSRLGGAFPDGVEINRLGLKDAIAETAAFLGGE